MHGVSNSRVLASNSKEYCHVLATAKYLINNSTFPTFFIKKPDQVYLNTWHGTPLKSMGRKMSDRPETTGNTQRNFMMADYLLYPNRYSFEHFVEDYMVKNYFSGKYILSGYPCNSIFFDETKRAEMRELLGIDEDTKLVVYMPTWRQAQDGGHKAKHFRMAEYSLMNIDENLADNVVMFAKLHYYDSGKSINLNKYKHINSFPTEYETYEVLCAADVLVTDYSSVMFDFLNAGKEIILYSYDEREYFNNRGAYLSLDDFPFRRTSDTYELCDWLNGVSDEEFDATNYQSMNNMFCSYDSPYASSKLCELLFDGKTAQELAIEEIDGSSLHNNKENILIFGGALTKNGLTTALMGVLNNVDLTESNYLLTFIAGKGRGARPLLNGLSNEMGYFPMQGNQVMTYGEAVAHYLYYRFNIKNRWVINKIRSLYHREAVRLFPGMHFDHVIHFTGYERRMVHTLLACNSENRIIYVHNDMVREKHLKNNFHLPSITRAYKEFDKIAVVRDSLRQVIADGFSVPMNKIHVVHNLNMIDQIKANAELPISFELDTASNRTVAEIEELLSDESTGAKFIDVARFSPEKGLDRLISAFERHCVQHPDSLLVIIGGLGKDYQTICEQAESSPASDRIVLIRNMQNPLSVLAKCDAFILSSHYEGLPMSIMEALIIGKKVISTNISGPREFLSQGYGYLVDDSEDGILAGLNDFSDGKLSALTPFDAEEFNVKALREFKELLNKR